MLICSFQNRVCKKIADEFETPQGKDTRESRIEASREITGFLP